MAEVGIAIVTFNSEREIGACLDAALTTGAEIVVVDNASADGTVKAATRPGVCVLANDRNRGFAAAVNQAFSVLNCPFVLLLNPDAVIVRGLEALRAACELPRAAGAGGALLDERGCAQVGFMVRNLPTPAVLILESLLLNRIWFRNPVNRRYRGLGLDYSARFEVEQPAGAFLMIRRDVWRELGGFDEKFWPLWFEDVDFCRRAVDRGFHLHFEPSAVAKHTGGHSISPLSLEKRRFYWYRSLLRYSAKHFSPLALRAVCAAVVLGAVPRLVADLATERKLDPLAAFGKVVRFAGRCLCFGWREDAYFEAPRSQ
jgi:N-acetylglucosaminyl-diphospho-decaprenol L-rhamnosyltransferase